MMGSKSNKPLGPLQLIPPAWPLQRWGMDLVSPLPAAQRNYKYVVVVVEYFTKWIKAKPLVNITSEAVRKFFWQNIICIFGVLKELTVDNGKQFDSQLFKEFCHSMGTKVMFISVYHPQSNGVVERANGIILSSIKKFLFDQKRENGQMNSRRLSGPTTPPSAGAPSSLHSDSSIELEAMSLEELKHKILISQNNIEPSMEADLTELYIFQALDNLGTY